jgi:hypothetical protein
VLALPPSPPERVEVTQRACRAHGPRGHLDVELQALDVRDGVDLARQRLHDS